jgi:hypothetical protein
MTTQPKMTIKEPTLTPSEQATAIASKTVTVADPRGRKITLKKPNVLAQYDLIEALEETAKNDVYVAMVLPLIYVIDIGGEPVLPAVNKMRIRALIQQLGEDGVNCVMTAVQENFGAQPAGGGKEAVKE